MLHLRYFIAVAEELSFSRAAARLHLSPSPLSRRIRDLERELGRDLFIRGHHHIELTTAGASLLPAAREIMRRVDAVPTLVREATGACPHTLTLGIAPEISAAVRTAVLTALSTHPDIAVRLHPADGAGLLRALQTGAVDLALVTDPIGARGVGRARLECQPIGVVVATGIGFDDRTSIHLDELSHLPYVSMDFGAGPTSLEEVEQLIRRRGAPRCTAATPLPPDGIAHVVATGQAFTLTGRCTGAEKVFAGEQVHVLPLEGINASITTVAAWREDRLRPGGALTGPVATLRDLAADRIRSASQPHPPGDAESSDGGVTAIAAETADLIARAYSSNRRK
ncbi:LysR family transcriptional regulator [Nocardia macrotermitis]|uniref:Hca operon transcriptional activator HcaR n=1 Tax=Nocardia macrotermitis TaxID=2585198 RepID=A0A7K0D3J3_9NOCA|nr:LysR family transcriptional regulator [Nocardia macrotermitis]MQY20201.1 Hca operon transcriptional activator HcaR [Nocardia macrotermitis]